MLRAISRSAGSLLIVFSMLLGFVGAFPVAISAQTDDKKQDKQDKKDKTADKSAPQAVGKKPLGANEDPSQIGKRKVNGGTDKLFGWLGGSQEKEIAIGRQLAAEVEQQAKLVEDQVITEYVNRVGQNIVLHSDAKIPFTIKVIDSDDVNAFALPGGFFFVNKGLILAADNESELAGVMAHEIAHVAARHAMENQGKGQLMNWGALAGIIFGGPIVSTVLQNAGGIMAGLASMKFSRGAEEEADRLGVQYLYAAGYDPTAMSTMFEKLNAKNKKKPNAFLKLFTTHPQNIDRRDTSLALVARFPEREEYVISTSEFDRTKSYLLRTSNARAGITSDFEDADPGRPTLKRRQPESTDAPGSDSGSSSSSDGPPQLKRKEAEQKPVPSPSPNN